MNEDNRKFQNEQPVTKGEPDKVYHSSSADHQHEAVGSFKVHPFMVSGGLDALIAALNFALAIKFFTTNNGWVAGILFLILGIRAAHFSYQLSVAWRALMKMEKQAEQEAKKQKAKPYKQEFPDGGLDENSKKQ